jgi:hypothetical protein
LHYSVLHECDREEGEVKSLLTVVAVLLLLSSCATAPSGAARTPLTSDVKPLSGQWAGVFTSHEMVSALGMVEAPARLTLTDDGRFTLTSSGGTVASGVARPTARGLVLEGRLTVGDPMAVGREVSFDLRPRGANALFGEGQFFYLGHRVDTEILLRRS